MKTSLKYPYKVCVLNIILIVRGIFDVKSSLLSFSLMVIAQGIYKESAFYVPLIPVRISVYWNFIDLYTSRKKIAYNLS